MVIFGLASYVMPEGKNVILQLSIPSTPSKSVANQNAAHKGLRPPAVVIFDIVFLADIAYH
jgi:hypothetical protein